MWSARFLLLLALAPLIGGCASGLALRTAQAPRSADPAPPTQAMASLRMPPAAAVPGPPVVVAPVPVAMPVAVGPAVAIPPGLAFEGEPPYTLDSADRLRIVVFGQDGLSNSYTVDQSGCITMPLIGQVTARGLTTDELARAIADKLRRGFVREPHVAIEVETYRPFFILGEVTVPGQYTYVPHMTVESAIAVAGGFTPRAYRWEARIDRPAAGGVARKVVPLLTRVRPGDTIIIKERWF
jgi:polysaccharide biosynthesis/export protein